MADNSDEAQRILESLAQSMSKHMQQQDDLTKELAAAEEQQKRVNESLKKFQTYMKDFGSTMVSADHGTAKYGNVVTGATDAMGGLLMKLGPLGIVVGLLVKAFGGLAAASLKQNEALVKSYRSLSEFGAIDSRGVEGLLDTLHQVGTTSEDVAAFQRTIQQVAPQLAIMGGSVAKGVDQIAKVTNTILNTGDLERQLKNLGYTTDQITDFGSKYMANAARDGSLRGKTTAEITKSSVEYMKTLGELTMLTGASRDEAQKVLEAQQLDVRWRAYTATLSAEERERANKAMLSLTLQNKNAADTIKDQIIMNGGVTTAKTAQFASYMGDSYRQVQALIKGTGDVTLGTLSILKQNAPQLQAALDNFGSTLMAGGADAAADLGISAQEYDHLQKMQNTNVEEFRKEIERIYAKSAGRIVQETEREKAERKTATAMDDLKFTVGNAVVPAMTNLAKVVEKVGSGLAEFTKFITFGKVDFTGLFKSFNDMEEVTLTIAAEDKKQLELKEKIRVEDEYIAKAKARIQADVTAGRDNTIGSNTNAVRKQLQLAEEKRAALREQMSTSTSTVSRAKTAGTVMNTTAETTVSDKKDDPLKGLKIKKGDVQKEGAPVDERLVKLMNAVQGGIPGFNYISSVNDQLHQNRNSKHKEGLAFDFTLGDWPSEEQGKKIADLIKNLAPELGQKLKIIDEYNHPSPGSTGGHMHAEIQAKTGAAMLKGPESGYLAQLHGEEGVFNKSQMQSLNNAITKTPISGGGSPTNAFDMDAMLDLFTKMNEKLETLVEKSSRSLDVQENILTYSKA
jgi:hypothetical protein